MMVPLFNSIWPIMNHSLYTAEQSRQLDMIARDVLGIDGYTLMKRAGQAAFDFLTQKWPLAKRLFVVCGGGNNGGDGWVVARLAHEAGLCVRVISAVDIKTLTGEAAMAYADAKMSGVVEVSFEAAIQDADVIVDGLLGTGFKGALRPAVVDAIEWINASHLPVLSLDIPSGVPADANQAIILAVQATATLSFIGWNLSHWTGPGRAFCGEKHLFSLGVPRQAYGLCEAVATLATVENRRHLAERDVDAHKGHFGHVVAIGGDEGMGGAISLASRAAQRCGAGLISVVTRPLHVSGLLASAPEVMVHGIDNPAHAVGLLKSGRIALVGPGLGQRPWGQALLQRVLASRLVAVIDADALNLLSVFGVEALRTLPAAVISPHPGEAARLLGISVAEVESDRLGAARTLHRHSGAVVVLKGPGTVIDDGEQVVICAHGNPGMASGGMGDVLSGIIAALLAQGMLPAEAARLAVVVHSAAADLLVEKEGACGLAASDLIPVVRTLLND